MANEIYTVGGAYIKDIADAIREKTGKTEGMTIAQMPQEILNIETGGSGNILFSNIDCYVDDDTLVVFPPQSGQIFAKVEINLFDEEAYEETEESFWISLTSGKHNSSHCSVSIDYEANRITITPKTGFSKNYMDGYAYSLVSESCDFDDLIYHLPDLHY